MKFLSTFLLFICVTFHVTQAQITLTQADMVNTGTTMAMATDDIPDASIVPGPKGSGQSWNFSALKSEIPDTIYVTAPSALPNSSSFPSANLGYKLQSGNDSVWGFMRKDADGFTIVGLVGIEQGNGDTIPVDFGMQLLRFPAQLGSKFVNHNIISDSAAEFGFDPDGPGPAPFVDSIRIKIVQITDSEIDASGSLTTPFGTFNSLRQYLIETFTDTAFMYANGKWQVAGPALSPFIFPIPFDTTYSYRWWSNQGVGFPLVELSMDLSNTNVEEVFWVADVPVMGTGISEKEALTLNVYPNPVNDILRIELTDSNSGSHDFRLTDMSGTEVMNSTFEGKRGSFNLEFLPSGTYLYQVVSANGSFNQGKLILQ